MANTLERWLGPISFRAAEPPAPIPPPRSGVIGAPDGIASLDSLQLGPFILPASAANWSLTRAAAWKVPAAAQALQVIAGTISTLPLRHWRGQVVVDNPTLIEQPDPVCPGSHTLLVTLEDLVLFPYAYWVILGRDSRGFPSTARHVPADLVSDRLHDEGYIRYRNVEYRDVIRFHSPTPGLLVTGRDALLTAWMLEMAAQRYAGEPIPSGYLDYTGTVDLEEDEIIDLLDDWAAARKARATAYLGPNVKYETTSFDAAQLQLVEGRQESAAEIARLLNLPPRYVNAPQAGGSSMTYTTLESSRRDLVDLCLAQYMNAITSRLSMDDACPRGQETRFDLSAFYRSDFGSLITAGVAGVTAQLFTVTEWRRLAGLPDTPTDAADAAAPADDGSTPQ